MNKIEAHHVDLRWTFYAVGRVSVGGDVECLIRILRVVEVVRDGKVVCTVEIEIDSREECMVIDLVCDRQILLPDYGSF